MTPRPAIALLGSGEFEPWSEVVDRWALEAVDGERGVAILPTASAPEGDDVFERWGRLGLDHYRSLGVRVEVLPLRTRRDADRPELTEQLDACAVVYFSGGNPSYLVRVLRGTRFWAALARRLGNDLAYIGCSAGAAALGALALDSHLAWTRREYRWREGLRLLPAAVFGPHWDTTERYVPGLKAVMLSVLPAGCCLVGIDERTALLGDGVAWSVVGAGGVAVYAEGRWETHPAGGEFEADLTSAPPPEDPT